MIEKIGVSDRVNIFFDRVEPELNVKVLDFPGGTRDSWKVQRMDGTIVQVQTYAKMVRLGLPGGNTEKIVAELAAASLSSIHAGVVLPPEKKDDVPEEDKAGETSLPQSESKKKEENNKEKSSREESPFKK